MLLLVTVFSGVITACGSHSPCNASLSILRAHLDKGCVDESKTWSATILCHIMTACGDQSLSRAFSRWCMYGSIQVKRAQKSLQLHSSSELSVAVIISQSGANHHLWLSWMKG